MHACLSFPCLLTPNRYAGCTEHFFTSFDGELRNAQVLALRGLFSNRLLLAATGVPIFHVARRRSPTPFSLVKNAAVGSIIPDSVRSPGWLFAFSRRSESISNAFLSINQTKKIR